MTARRLLADLALLAAIMAAGLRGADGCPPGQGEWTTQSGAVECRPCLPATAYGDTTPLARGCPAERPGILWTVGADAAVAGELAAADTLAAGYEGLAARLQADVALVGVECAADLARGAGALNDCAGSLRAAESGRWSTRITWLVVGAALGVAAYAGVGK